MPITDKSKLSPIEYHQLSPEEIFDSLLENFTRYQETRRVLALVEGQLVEKKDYFIDAWDEKKLTDTSRYLRKCAQDEGIIIGAFQDKTCIGFVSVESKIFGSRNQYVEMTFCHVTRELRGAGIGKQLFLHACEEGRKRGVEKFYISTHPAVGTQAFYRAMGCILAQEVNPEILAREPLDIQLEKHL